jgi:hypothetical protein
MRVLGFEPRTYGLKGHCSKSISLTDKELTKDETSHLSTGLDKIVQKYPDLKLIIESWPRLPENIKIAIINQVRESQQ